VATVIFTPFIQHHVCCPDLEVYGNTVREILDGYFTKHRPVRGYILDEQGCLRPRLALFVDGAIVMDRIALSDPVHLRARILVQQLPLDTEYENLD
jgi:molybdopterin synthase sulfur carrier subunit